MQYDVVAAVHVLLPSQFGKRRVLSLPDMMKLVRVAVAVARRPSLADEVGIVIVLPLVPVGKLLLEPFLSAVEGTPVNIRPDKGSPVADAPLHQPRSNINLRLLTGVEEAHDVIRPPRALLDLLLEV